MKHFLSCPICQYGLTLDAAQLAQIQPVAEINQLLVDGKITQEEHQRRIDLLTGTAAAPVQAEPAEAKVLAEGQSSLKYCENCGTGVVKDIKFCGNCGTQVTKAV